MKRRMLLQLILIGCGLNVWAQNPCGDEYTTDVTGKQQVVIDYSQHSTGDHNATMQGNGECEYEGNNINVACTVGASATGYGTSYMDEWGVLTKPYGTYTHVTAIGFANGTANGESPQSATETTVGGATSCLLDWCSGEKVSVAYPPLSYTFSPSTQLWQTSQTWANNCPKEYPTYCEEPPPPNNCKDRWVWDDQLCRCKYLGGSPILIDTRNTGFHLSSPEKGQCIEFDLRGDGKKECWSWPVAGSGNGWLALDRNHNGKIDDGKELFGNFTDQQTMVPLNPRGIDMRNGYVALSEFDKPENGGNSDWVIDENDKVYDRLMVWIDDSPRDGITQPSELHTLRSLGIRSISLIPVVSQKQDPWGNSFKWAGELNVAASEVRDRSNALHEKAMKANGKGVDVQSYDVWLVDSEKDDSK
jgi:hypothetical protein